MYCTSCCHVIYVLLLRDVAYKCTQVKSDLKAKMEIEIPNRTSNGYYNVKKYIVIKTEFGSKTRELQFEEISGQEKKIQVQLLQLQVAEWEWMKENYFSPDNVTTNKGQVVLSDKLRLQLEEWISPEQNKYLLIKFVQRDKGADKYKNLPYPYSLTVSE